MDRMERFTAPFRFFKNLWDKPAVVLAYHRVTHISVDPLEMAVSPEHFDKQMQFLKKNYHVVSIEEFTEYLYKRKRFYPKTVVITFDDGYADNLHEAFPILDQYHLPATFFITTRWIDKDEIPWWDELTLLCFTRTWPEKIALNGKTYLTKNFKDKMNTYQIWMRLFRLSTMHQIKAYLSEIYQQLGGTISEIKYQEKSNYRMLSKNELKQLAKNTHVTIGNHTHDHVALGILALEKQMEEIDTANHILQEITGYPIRYISYPFGSKKWIGKKRFYNEDTIKACKQLNMATGLANYYGQVHSNQNPFTIPRILVRNWELSTFERFMKRIYTY